MLKDAFRGLYKEYLITHFFLWVCNNIVSVLMLKKISNLHILLVLALMRWNIDA